MSGNQEPDLFRTQSLLKHEAVWTQLTPTIFFFSFASIKHNKQKWSQKNVNFDYLWPNGIRILDSDVESTLYYVADGGIFIVICKFCATKNFANLFRFNGITFNINMRIHSFGTHHHTTATSHKSTAKNNTQLCVTLSCVWERKIHSMCNSNSPSRIPVHPPRYIVCALL